MILLFLSLLFAQEVMVYAEAPQFYRNGTKIRNYLSNTVTHMNAAKHIKLAKVKSQYGWEFIENNEGVFVWNGETIKYKFSNCDYSADPLRCSIENKHYYLRTFVNLTEEEGLITQTLYGKQGEIITSSQISNKKIVIWIKQQELTVFEGGFHKPKEELPLKWEIPYVIYSNDFEQLSLRLWSGVKLK